MGTALAAPFPWFGGKRKIAADVWAAFGNPENYIEPFLGSAAVLLARPTVSPLSVETVNDADGLLANFWRALQSAPDVVAHYCDWPVNEADLHARHLWLNSHRRRITDFLMGDPHWYDPQAAGWWAWGASAWIGSGWCGAAGPWVSVDGQFVACNAGRGVHRQSVHLSSAGMGVHRKSVHLGDAGRGVASYLRRLSERLRYVRVNCGDWSRVVGDSVLRVGDGSTAVFLDPPYDEKHSIDYAVADTGVAAAVYEWAVKHGDAVKIALCSYGMRELPPGWTEVKWKAHGGYGSQGRGRGRENSERETVLFSPACCPVVQCNLAI